MTWVLRDWHQGHRGAFKITTTPRMRTAAASERRASKTARRLQERDETTGQT